MESLSESLKSMSCEESELSVEDDIDRVFEEDEEDEEEDDDEASLKY